MSRFSCCCDWGFDFLYPRPATVWYLSQSDGTTPRLLKLDRSTGIGTEDSAFADAGLIACMSEIGGVQSFYAVSGNKILKYDFNGLLDWTYTATGMSKWVGTGNDAKDSICADASGNTYICGHNAVADAEARVDKVDSSGTQVWSATAIPPAGRDYTGRAVAVDASGNVVVVGQDNSNNLLVSYFNSAGVEQWTLDAADSTPAINPHKVTFDSSGNIYIVIFSGTVDLLSYDSSGTLRFSKPNGYIFTAPNRTIDIKVFDGKLYTSHSTSAPKEIVLSRRSDASLSTLDWSVAIPWTESSVIAHPRIAVSANGNLYACWTTFTSPNRFGYHTKRLGSDGSEVFLETAIGNHQPLVPPGDPPAFI